MCDSVVFRVVTGRYDHHHSQLQNINPHPSAATSPSPEQGLILLSLDLLIGTFIWMDSCSMGHAACVCVLFTHTMLRREEVSPPS